jgi:hypothetical protein
MPFQTLLCNVVGGVWTVARLHLKVPPMTARVCDHDTGSQGAFLLSVGGVTLKQVTCRCAEHFWNDAFHCLLKCCGGAVRQCVACRTLYIALSVFSTTSHLAISGSLRRSTLLRKTLQQQR